MKKLDPGPIPKYYQLAKILAENIGANELLPSYRTLMKEYNISLGTVRQAIAMLKEEGLVRSEQGKGTFSQRTSTTKKNHLIGVIIPRVHKSKFGAIVESIEEVLSSKGYHMILCNSHDDTVNETKDIKSLKERKVMGIIFGPSHLTKSVDNIKLLGVYSIPFLLLSRMEEADTDYISDDGEKGAYKLVKYLLELGHRRIAFIGGCFDIGFPERITGYKKALREYGVRFNQTLLMVTQSQRVKNLSRSIKILLTTKNKPTAIFAINDKAAVNIIKVLHNLKAKVPEEISIVGYDNIEAIPELEVPLTTVSINTSEIGSEAAEALISKIEENGANKTYKKLIEPELIIRKSSVAPQATLAKM